MVRKDLNNKPLVEAILELRWVLLASEAGMESDQHYPLLLGRFSERVQRDYPFHEPLPTSQIPMMAIPNMVQHRFRVDKSRWPLLQIGPGIMTVNETSGYRWPDFRKRCEAAVKSIFEAHPSPKDFKIKEIILRYINAVEFDYSKENIFDFMHEKMRTTISLPDTLFTEDFTAKSNPSNFSWQSTFQKKNPAGSVVLRFSTGKREGVPSLIWETRIISAGDQFPGIDTKIIEWLESAHDVAYDWFFKLIEGELERRFS